MLIFRLSNDSFWLINGQNGQSANGRLMPVGDLFLPFIALTALECHDNGLVNPYYQTLMTERYVSRKFSALGSSFLTRTAQIARK